MPSAMDDAERVHATTRKAWRSWLSKHHEHDTGVWLVSWKKATGKPAVGYAEAVEEALCFGWIDSKGRKLDDDRSMLWFAPRSRRSAWSKSNKDRVKRLQRDGLMTEAGAKVIAAAKRSGTWAALDEVEAMVCPPDLEAAFRRHPGSRTNSTRFRSLREGGSSSG